MYAIIADGGRQYKVEEGQELEIDYRDVAAGEQVTFDNVLAVSAESGVKVGTPSVPGASVTAEVLGETAGDKIYIQKFRRRKNYRRRTGHRQPFTAVRISKINADVGQAPAPAEASVGSSAEPQPPAASEPAPSA